MTPDPELLELSLPRRFRLLDDDGIVIGIADVVVDVVALSEGDDEVDEDGPMVVVAVVVVVVVVVAVDDCGGGGVVTQSALLVPTL